MDIRIFQSPRETEVYSAAILEQIIKNKPNPVLLLALGEEKAEAVVDAVYGEVHANLPASILQLYPNVAFVLDESSAKLFLKREEI